jgi:hypothetical protein
VGGLLPITKLDSLATSPKLNRRGFLGALSPLAVSKGLPSPAPEGPILDIHQHTNYTGRTDQSDYANLYGDLSAGSGANAMTRDPDFAQDFLERHYMKLLWGSDCPCRDGKGEAQRGGCIAGRCLAALRKLMTDRSKLRRILYENGAALYNLPLV